MFNSLKSTLGIGATGSRPANMRAADAVKLHGEPDTVFIDVRSSGEIAMSGTIKRALRVPLQTLQLQADPHGPHHADLTVEKRVVIVCASGARSGAAANMLSGMGYRDVINIADGFGSWVRAGGPSER
jgi:rhodanese-related sulfurtransferase